MDKLREFYLDEKMFGEVFSHLLQELREHAADCAMSGQDTAHIVKTAQFIEQSRSALEKMFAQPTINKPSFNESR